MATTTTINMDVSTFVDTKEKKPVRITKAQRFNDIKALLRGEKAKFGTSVEAAIAFCDNELELLSKKNGKNTKKAAEKAAENEHLENLILEYLAEKDTEVTCSQVFSEVPEFSSSQKVAYHMKALKASGQVTAQKGKGGQMFFSLA